MLNLNKNSNGYILFESSLKYVVLDPANVTKYGFNAALSPYLKNKVLEICINIADILVQLVFSGSRFRPNTSLSKFRKFQLYGISNCNLGRYVHFTATIS